MDLRTMTVLCLAMMLAAGAAVPAIAFQAQPKNEKPAQETGNPGSAKPESKEDDKAKKDTPAAKKASPKPPKKVLPKDVVQASNNFQHEAPCKTCSGTGEVSVSKVIGRDYIAPGVSKPVTTTEKVQCSNCKGERVATHDGLIRHGKEVARTMGTVDTTHTEWAKQLPRITENLKKAARVSAQGWRSRCVGANDTLENQTVAADEPVLVVVSLKSDEGTGAARRVTFSLGTKELALTDPRVVWMTSSSKSGSTRVLVGGLFVKSENNTLHIRSGFAIDCE